MICRVVAQGCNFEEIERRHCEERGVRPSSWARIEMVDS